MTILVILILALWPLAAEAYVGPGAGFALVGSFLTAFVALLAGFLSLLTFPVRFAIRSLRRRRALARAKVKRVIVLGLDGLDPNLVERWMATGDLPGLSKLAETGSFSRLRTTYPSISPVAWSSFMTGVDPSRHNIFDFLTRDTRTYKPDLSSVKIGSSRRTVRIGQWVFPVGKPGIRGLRRSKAFWTVLGEHRIPSNVIRVPLTFPPEKFAGVLLSAMCVPDLKGTQGSFAFYSTDPAKVETDGTLSAETTGGERHRVELRDGRIEATLTGPDDPLREGETLSIPFSLDVEKERAGLRIQGQKLELRLREYSPWVTLRFRAGFGVAVNGIARFYLTELGEHVGLYVTPLNIDPGKPALPISFPGYYSIYLSKLIGQFATLGLAEDTWALNERVIDEEAFLQQTLELHAEREAMFLNAVEKSREGLVACVFDGTDRLQHMFFRYLDPDHPANAGKDVTLFKDAIRDMYRRADALVSRVHAGLGPDDHLLVISDHGFQSFRRGVNLNTWLREQGLLVLQDGAGRAGEWFEGVDWTRTKAYAFGLGGLYLNLEGREAQGIVKPGAEARALKAEIMRGLSGLRDEARDEIGINEAFDNETLHPDGPYRENGPDLIVGYNRGYRASWEGAVGQTTNAVFTDNTRSWSGDHCIDPRLVPGVLFSNRAMTDPDPAIVDLAPTILTEFGVEVPGYMTGRALPVES